MDLSELCAGELHQSECTPGIDRNNHSYLYGERGDRRRDDHRRHSVSDNDLASGLQGAVIKDDDKDLIVWKDYLSNVMKKRGASWRGLYSACQVHVGE